MIDQEQDKLAFILPASVLTTQESGILWYEVTVLETESRCLMVGFSETDEGKLTQAETTFLSETSARTILTKGSITLTIEMTISKTNYGEPHVQFRINGYEVDIHSLAKGSESTMANFKLDLSDTQIQLLMQWSRLGESVMTMGEITAAKSPTNSNTWGCASCFLLLAGGELAGAGCVVSTLTGALPTALLSCGATLTNAGLIVEHCPGSCS